MMALLVVVLRRSENSGFVMVVRTTGNSFLLRGIGLYSFTDFTPSREEVL
jgi:hypothetical protein